MDYFGGYQSIFDWDARDKPEVKKYYITKMLRLSNRMFSYENLSAHIDQNILEWYLQTCGFLIAVKHNDKLYILPGAFGGTPNEMYIPTEAIISNPYLQLNKSYTINKDCVLIKNDSMLQGLLPIYRRYTDLICENDITMQIASINTRISSLITADDDTSFESAKKYIEDIETGKLGIIMNDDMIMNDGIKVQPTASEANSNIYTQLTEYDRYLWNSMLREIGLGANNNTKRENISENESTLDDDGLLPLVDDMLLCRQKWCDEINDMFGENISVQLNSAWDKRRKEMNEDGMETDEGLLSGSDE